MSPSSSVVALFKAPAAAGSGALETKALWHSVSKESEGENVLRFLKLFF